MSREEKDMLEPKEDDDEDLIATTTDDPNDAESQLNKKKRLCRHPVSHIESVEEVKANALVWSGLGKCQRK